MRTRLVELGQDRVRVYDAGWPEWAADETLPVERLARHDRLVHTGWLRALLAGETPEAAPTGAFLLFHVNFGVPEEYEESHLPGAFYLDTNQLENPIDWNRRSPEELEAALRSLGIAHDTTVILYGRDTEGEPDEKWPGRRAGQIAATRAAMILRYCGVDDVRLLDGGYDAWVHDGNPLENIVRTPDGGARVRRRHPSASRGDRRHRRGEADPRRSRERRPRQRPNLERARRHGQRLQLHRPRRTHRRRRLGQLRLGRVPHAALPHRGQHDACVSRDRGQLGGGRHHRRQVGRLLLRDGVARERDLVLRLPDGLAAHRRLRRRLVRMEPGPRTPTRSRSASPTT